MPNPQQFVRRPGQSYGDQPELPVTPGLPGEHRGGVQFKEREQLVNTQLTDIINQGGQGLDPEQLAQQYSAITQQLEPQYMAALQSINEDASRRGLFRSGIPLAKQQQTQQQQAQHYGQIRQQLEFENERIKNRTLLTALQMLSTLQSEAKNRMVYMDALEQQQKASNQGELIDFGISLLPYVGDAINFGRELFSGDDSGISSTGGF